MKGTIRQRYSLAISIGYIGVGVIIMVRSVLADVLPLVVLGIVFLALGAVRIRDYLKWRHQAGGL